MTAIVDIEEDRILKGVRATEAQLELWRSSQGTGKLIDELVEPLLIDFVRTFRFVADKAELLHGNMEKMIGMGANDGEWRERPPDFIERRFQG